MQSIISDLASLAANTALTPTERLCALETLESLVRLGLVNDKRVFHTIKHLRQLVSMAMPVAAGVYFMKFLTGPDAGKVAITGSLDCNTMIPSQLRGVDHTVLLGFISTNFDPKTSQNDIIDALRGWLDWCASVLNNYLTTPYQKGVGMFWVTISDDDMRRFIEYAEQKIAEQRVDAVAYNHLMTTADIQIDALPERFVSSEILTAPTPRYETLSAAPDPFRLSAAESFLFSGPIVVEADPQSVNDEPTPNTRKPWNINIFK